MYADESEIVKRNFINFATKNHSEQQHYVVIDMNSLTVADDDKSVRKYLVKPMMEVRIDDSNKTTLTESIDLIKTYNTKRVLGFFYTNATTQHTSLCKSKVYYRKR
jgi:hypothetical protein